MKAVVIILSKDGVERCTSSLVVPGIYEDDLSEIRGSVLSQGDMRFCVIYNECIFFCAGQKNMHYSFVIPFNHCRISFILLFLMPCFLDALEHTTGCQTRLISAWHFDFPLNNATDKARNSVLQATLPGT